QWTVLALSFTVALYISGGCQEQIELGRLEYWVVFLVTGLPPLLTALIGWRNIEEIPITESAPLQAPETPRASFQVGLRSLRARFAEFRKSNRTIWFMV